MTFLLLFIPFLISHFTLPFFPFSFRYNFLQDRSVAKRLALKAKEEEVEEEEDKLTMNTVVTADI